MTVPPDRPPSGARAFGGLRGTSVVLLLSTLAGLLGLAGALLVAPLAADRFGEAPSVAASRAALSTLETARGALADPDPAQTEETRRARASVVF